MKFVMYDLYLAYHYNVDKHPQDQMKELGFKVIHGVPQSIGDCWWFCVEDYDIQLPKYIQPMKPYSLKYWKDKCWETCEYFKKYFDIKTQTRYPEFCCYRGEKCFKEINN